MEYMGGSSSFIAVFRGIEKPQSHFTLSSTSQSSLRASRHSLFARSRPDEV